MPKKTSGKSQDRKRVSSEAHEIEYTAGKVAKQTGSPKAKASVALKSAKKSLGRNTSRPAVESKAKKAAAK